MSLIKKFNKYNKNIIVEDSGSAASTGVAVASQGSTTGMGNVVASQPSSVPGAAFTGDGTVGSGDIGMPLRTYTKAGATGDKYVKMKKIEKDRVKGLNKQIEDFLKHNKKGNKDNKGNFNNKSIEKSKSVMDYQSFLKDQTKQVSK